VHHASIKAYFDLWKTLFLDLYTVKAVNERLDRNRFYFCNALACIEFFSFIRQICGIKRAFICMMCYPSSISNSYCTGESEHPANVNLID
jgi:hypothetical protein